MKKSVSILIVSPAMADPASRAGRKPLPVRDRAQAPAETSTGDRSESFADWAKAVQERTAELQKGGPQIEDTVSILRRRRGYADRWSWTRVSS